VRVPLGLELLRVGFFLRLRALSLYVSSGILPTSPPDAQVFIVSFSDNEQVRPPLPFPSCSTKPWKWGRRGIWVPDLLPIVLVRWLGIACLHGLSLTTVLTRHASIYSTRSMARHRLSTWPFTYHGVDSVCFYHL
jgi:hypothetical protein